MILNKKPYVSKYKEPGYYITSEFMHGDGDATTQEEYFIPDDENSMSALAAYDYLTRNIDREDWDSSDFIEKVAPGFFWPSDCTGWDGLADLTDYTILYWDGSQLFECDIELEDGDVSQEIINFCNRKYDDMEDENDE